MHVADRIAAAYIKPVPVYQIVREVLCALIAQDVGLPALRPGVVLVEDTPLSEHGRYAFGTLATDTRELQGMRDDTVLRSQLARWQHMALAVAFDEWIANSDRTPSNLLFRGASQFVLIDHGEAIPADLPPDGASTTNLLARLAYSDVSRDEEFAAVRRVQNAATAFSRVNMAAIENASLAGSWDPDAMLPECCRLLTDRLPHLPDLIAQRFGDPQRNLPMQPRRGTTRP
ncbi:MAG: hypothetical protein OXG82_16150 [Gammaproteobacteria bacterium]|nr:hypothetical protein [Gammaproteobacteria bacterium]